MKLHSLSVLFLITFALTFGAPKRIRVLLWSEQTEPRNIYPNGISGALADYLGKLPNMEARTVKLDDPDTGVSDATLDQTDVLIWFGHRKHAEVPDEVVDRIVKHVRERGMGFIALHSSHYSKALKKLLNATGAWSSYVNHGKPEQMWVVLPDHPIAKGIKDFTIPQTEIYTEPFEVPQPEAVVFEGTWESGHRNREVLVWQVGKGRVVYIRPGHEEYPIYFQPEMQKLVANAVEWAAGRTHAPKDLKRREAGPPASAFGPYRQNAQPQRSQADIVVVLNKADGTVDLFNSSTGEKTASIETGSHPHEVAVSPDGSTAFVTLYGNGVYGKNPEPDNKLAVINLRSRTEESVIDLGSYKGPHGLAVGSSGMVWVTCENEKTVLVIDPKQKKITSAIPTGTTGTHWVVLLPNGSKAYTSNKETPYISVIDTSARKVIKEIPVPRGIEGIGVSPEGDRVYAGDFKDPVLWVIDTQKDKVIKNVALKNRPGRVRVTPDNRLIIISEYAPGAIEVLDVATLTTQKLIPVGKAPMGITFSHSGKWLFAANSGENTVSVINLQTLEVTHTATAGNGPDGIAFATVRH
ncbi:MAG TPA: ThuA domain-containing protein [Acidobacteriota bacterium]|jgi:YVTN family beta-propeller protein|nr:ThuA domain-containing protein [Acidobacteriota bacterium]